MRITELLKQESIGLNERAENKEQAIDKLVTLMEAGGRLKDKAGYKAGILAREGLGSTAIGEGIAIPHAKVEAGLKDVAAPASFQFLRQGYFCLDKDSAPCLLYTSDAADEL